MREKALKYTQPCSLLLLMIKKSLPENLCSSCCRLLLFCVFFASFYAKDTLRGGARLRGHVLFYPLKPCTQLQQYKLLLQKYFSIDFYVQHSLHDTHNFDILITLKINLTIAHNMAVSLSRALCVFSFNRSQ